MRISAQAVQTGLAELGLTGQDVAVHSSLSSFGHVIGGAETVIRALLHVCGTVLMPTFCGIGRTNAPADDRPAQNAWDYQEYNSETEPIVPFDPTAFDRTSGLDVDEMGQIPAALLRHTDTVRSQHPSVSWAANGPLARCYTSAHLPDDPNLPLKRLADTGGRILLMGVGLPECTAVHLAEELAGRRPFIRWVMYADGKVRRVREYGCSNGFARLTSHVEPLATRCTIDRSSAVSYPVKPFVEAISQAIRSQPEITLCGRGECRCQDSVRGGPIDAGQQTAAGDADKPHAWAAALRRPAPW